MNHTTNKSTKKKKSTKAKSNKIKRPKMSGYEFEEHCAKKLKKLGYKNIEMTKKSGDQGVDILCSKRRKRYAVQCKIYSKPVGNYAVQEANSGMQYYDCDKSIVMTNSTFTKSAKELAEKLDVILMEKVALPKSKLFYLVFLLIAALFAFILTFNIIKSGILKRIVDIVIKNYSSFEIVGCVIILLMFLYILISAIRSK